MMGEIEQALLTARNEICDDAEEARYLARARVGDQDAIGWLIARYRQRVVRLAARILRRPEEAEDVAQEAFLRAFRNLRSFRGKARFYTWLYQIVVRICLDRQRILSWNLEEPLNLDALHFEMAHRPMDRADDHVLVNMLLDHLSPPMRAMLVLRELEGLEYEEIARVLDIPVGRVKWRLHEARAQFRILWEAAAQEVNRV